MTDEQILTFGARVNYAHIAIDEGNYIGYGRARWEQTVPMLSPEQREKLVAKIEYWQALERKEVKA